MLAAGVRERDVALNPSVSELGARPTHAGATRPALALVADEELAQRAQEGSAVSFGELVDRYEARLKGYLRRRVGCGADVEDLAQETLVRAWRSLSRFDPERRFSTWLFTIANRIATDHFRSSKRERAKREAAAFEDVGPSPEPGLKDEDVDLWRIAEAVLSQEQLSGLWLRYAADMPIEDIATVLGKSNVAARVMLFRARERLAQSLEQRETRGSGRTNTNGGPDAFATGERAGQIPGNDGTDSARAPGGVR